MKAKVVPAAFTVLCPKCQEPVSEPHNGSQVWEDWQMEADKTYTCLCGAEFSIKMPGRFLK